MSANLTIPEGLTIQLDYKNCLMPHQEPDGSISRPFVLPKENAKFFEFHNRVNKVKTKQPITPISLYSKGIKLKEGILKLNKFTEDGKFDCDFIFDAGAFNSIIKGKYLNDISYLYEPVATNVLADWYAYMTSTAGQTYPTVDVTFFPVYTSEVEIKTPLDDADRIETFRNLYPACMIANYWDRANEQFGFPETDVNGDAVTFLGGERAIIPFWYTGKVIEEVFKYAGYTIKDNVFKTNTILQKLVLFNLNTDREQPDIFANDNFHISFKYDLPNILISDLIEELRKRGIIFNIKEDRREVDIMLLKDIVNGTYDKDLSTKTGRKKTIEFNNTGKIKFAGDGDGYLQNAEVITAAANGTLHVVNSRDYDINDDPTTDVYVIRDEKVIKTWKKADYTDTDKTMFNTEYESNNYYEAANGTDGEEIEISTKSEVIENKEIRDIHEGYDWFNELTYKKLMPYTDVIREYKASKIKTTTPFAFMFYWGKVEQPLQDDRVYPFTHTTFFAPFGSSSNEIIKPVITHGNTLLGAVYSQIYILGELFTGKFKVGITFTNPTNADIDVDAYLYVSTDLAFDGPHIGDTEYEREEIQIQITIPANGTNTFESDFIDYVYDPGETVPKDFYFIIDEPTAQPDTFHGIVLYADRNKLMSLFSILHQTRECFRHFNNTKEDINSPFINYVKQDVTITSLLADATLNIGNTDVPYNKGTINNDVIISTALDKWVPYFLQEYVDMMLSANTIRIERLMQLTVEDLKEMTLMKKYINNPDDAETGEYLIEEMSVAVKSDGVSAARCRMIKIN